MPSSELFDAFSCTIRHIIQHQRDIWRTTNGSAEIYGTFCTFPKSYTDSGLGFSIIMMMTVTVTTTTSTMMILYFERFDRKSLFSFLFVSCCALIRRSFDDRSNDSSILQMEKIEKKKNISSWRFGVESRFPNEYIVCR